MMLLRAFAGWWARSLLLRLVMMIVVPLFVLLVVLPVEILAVFVGGNVSTLLGLSRDAKMCAVFVAFFALVALGLEIAERIRLRFWRFKVDRYLKGRKNSN
jgi:hypothetical protein